MGRDQCHEPILLAQAIRQRVGTDRSPAVVGEVDEDNPSHNVADGVRLQIVVAVDAVISVVAQEKHASFRDQHGLGNLVLHRLGDVGLGGVLAVQEERTTLYRDAVARHTYNPFDEVGARFQSIVQNHDVTAVVRAFREGNDLVCPSEYRFHGGGGDSEEPHVPVAKDVGAKE